MGPSIISAYFKLHDIWAVSTCFDTKSFAASDPFTSASPPFATLIMVSTAIARQRIGFMVYVKLCFGILSVFSIGLSFLQEII